MSYTIHNGDCLNVLAELDENSIDTCITDPPYELGFMGKRWDSSGVAFQVATWEAVYRVLKPGAILLAFGGTRTYHRMVCAIEDAGFEIRDTIAWVYGSGFPKSYDISKGIDKQAGAERETKWYDRYHDGRTRQNLGTEHMRCNALAPIANGNEKSLPSTPEAQLWHGWGTALKPAFEPIVVAMKPVDGTFVNNALTWGVAGLNIDGGRVELNGSKKTGGGCRTREDNKSHLSFRAGQINKEDNSIGRFPANLIHDGSDEALAAFPHSNGAAAPVAKGQKEFGGVIYGKYKSGGDDGASFYNDSGSAARFFYCAKSSRRERNNGLDGYLTVKYNNDKSNNGGLSWKDVSTVAVQLLRKVTLESIVTWNIGECGESITGQCLKDSLSTTLTAISKTIESKILHSLTLSLTNEYTAGVNYEMVNGGSPAESVESLRKWILTTTNGSMELARGASNVALQMLLKTKNADAWSQATNFHSTVKPIELMRYLVRLTKTPTGGVVLDPFAGSGTTGIACVLEGRDFVGIEREPDYIEIAEKRIEHWAMQPEQLRIE